MANVEEEVSAAPAPKNLRLHYLDLVRFELGGGDDEKKHGDRGLVVYSEPRTTLMCIDGVVVDKKDAGLVVLDRSLLYPGMHVTAASDPAGQIGVVTAVSTAVDLVEHQVDGDYGAVAAEAGAMRGVSPAGLRRVRDFSLGDYVVSGQWLGRVVEVCVAVDVVFDDGAMCRFTGDVPQSALVELQVVPLMHTRCEVNGKFYPGQRVTGHHKLARPANAFKHARWLRGYWKLSRIEATVAKVTTTGVVVYWIASAQLGTSKNLLNASAPPAFQKPQDLTIFCSDDACPWALGDRCFLATSQRRRRPPVPTDDKQEASPETTTTTAAAEQDDVDDDQEPSHAAAPSPEAQAEKKEKPYRNQLRKFFFKKDMRTTRWGGKATAVEKTMVVSGTTTTADVLWQDGALRRGVPSLELIPFDVLNEHEFFPGEHIESDSMAAADGSEAKATRVGVVRSVDPKDQTVRVSWLDAAPLREEEAERGGETVVSAYDLRKYNQHDVYYGDVVIRLLPPQPEPAGAGDEAPPASADLSWVGRVIDVRDCHVHVQWGNGETSTELYHEAHTVDMRSFMGLLYEVGPWLEDEGDSAAARAQQPPAAAANNNAGNNVANARATGNTGGGGGGGANAPAPPPTLTGHVSAAVQSVIGVASQLLAQGRSYLVSGSSSSSSSSSSTAATANAVSTAPPEPAAGGDVNVEHGNGVAVEAEAAAADDAVESSDASGGDDADDSAGKGKKKMDATGGGDDESSLGFAHFDVVQCPPDHHYLDSKREGTEGNKWLKRVQNEWKVLGDDNLPGTIYVRVFEDRMDLLRAAMVGAAGTPYHDGLFLFDLHLPPSYPAAPPEVYYHSFGLRVNPNLYPSGTVCLSLLNTFDGDGTEVWSPASTLLQVVVSIQGLVLTGDPYYNEAGYEEYVGTPEGRRNAFSYAENSYLLTLRSALHLLRRPPRGFEDLVRGHFRRRGRHVLAACESYLRGSRVAGDGSDAEPTCSVGFRLALSNIVPVLVKAFMEIAADGCDQFSLVGASDDAASSDTTN